jgi:hypothetical protein
MIWFFSRNFISSILTSIFCYHADTSETNAVFCPKYWVKFRTSCYKLYQYKWRWQDARAYCERVRGATLVSLDDKEEEDYVKNIMKSNGVDKFHKWPGTSSSSRFAFMCEYRLGEIQGLNHFESEISLLGFLTNLFLQ